jgi:hypothetical protein
MSLELTREAERISIMMPACEGVIRTTTSSANPIQKVLSVASILTSWLFSSTIIRLMSRAVWSARANAEAAFA